MCTVKPGGGSTPRGARRPSLSVCLFVCFFVCPSRYDAIGTESLDGAYKHWTWGNRHRHPGTILVIVLVLVIQQAATYSIAAVAGNWTILVYSCVDGVRSQWEFSVGISCGILPTFSSLHESNIQIFAACSNTDITRAGPGPAGNGRPADDLSDGCCQTDRLYVSCSLGNCYRRTFCKLPITIARSNYFGQLKLLVSLSQCELACF